MSKLTPEQIQKALKATPSTKNKSNIRGIEEEEIDVSVSFDEIDSFGNKDSISEMYRDIASYNRMIQERITFINPALTAAIPFTRENLYLICAYTGNGKSTIAANISRPLWKEQKKVLTIKESEKKTLELMREKGVNPVWWDSDFKGLYGEY